MEITTERLILREFREDDLAALLAYRADPRYREFYAWDEVQLDRTRELLRMFLARQREQPRIAFQLAVVLKSGSPLIGNCGIRMASAGAYEAEIGYELSPEYWGHGYATEAARAVVQFGFAQLRLHRISSWCIAHNARSARVLQKLGMQREGRLRDKAYFKGRWWDTLLYGILDHEWQAQHQAKDTAHNALP